MQTQTHSLKKKTRPTKTKSTKAAKKNPVTENFEGILKWYSEINSSNITEIHQHYSKDVFFKDPLTEVYNSDDMVTYYTKVYERFQDMRFVIDNRALDGQQAFITWVMTAKMMGRDITIRGVSHMKFDLASGLCEYHRDYFDMSEEVYEQVPVVGALVKGLKNLLN